MEFLCSHSKKELEDFFFREGDKRFRAHQVFQWVYKKKEPCWDAMSDLSQPLREKLKKNFLFPSLIEIGREESSDGETTKFLWELHDSRRVESVLILAPNRRTVCVSSQIGCPARCAFCASGKEGFFRNLTAAEIVEQVLWIGRELEAKGEKVTHLVFMGMGEPLENYDAVVKAISLFTDPDGFGFSPRRITLSTVGVIEGIQRLSSEGIKVNLALSLHAPNQNIRKKIIPYARKYPFEEVLKALDDYAEVTKRDITYEYTLLEGINDGASQAEELALLLKGKPCTVNLIPYNPVIGLHLRRPSRHQVERFRAILQGGGIRTTWRYTKGKDIQAACGQLALPMVAVS